MLAALAHGLAKTGEVAELIPQVKNLFLQLHNFAGGQIRESQPALRGLQFPPQNGLLQTTPPATSLPQPGWPVFFAGASPRQATPQRASKLSETN